MAHRGEIQQCVLNTLVGLDWWMGATAESLCCAECVSNDNRPMHWRASGGERCYCAATWAPCSVCTNSAECVECGSIELMDMMETSKHGLMCIICDERKHS